VKRIRLVGLKEFKYDKNDAGAADAPYEIPHPD
jgi:hypothetical protein